MNDLEQRICKLETAVNLLTERLIEISLGENAYITVIDKAKKIYDQMLQTKANVDAVFDKFGERINSHERYLHHKFEDVDKLIKTTLIEMALKNGVTVSIATPETWEIEDE